MTAQQQVDVLTEQFVRGFVERWLVAWESADVDRIVSLCADDVVADGRQEAGMTVLHVHG